MRIISGRARGTKLITIEGQDTRPTTDRVKEAIFSMLHSEVYETRALDLFAGSGALGLELISRGGSHVTFVEQSRHAMDCIQKNIEKTHFEGQVRCMQQSVEQALKALKEACFDIVFMDPPYHKGYINDTITMLRQYDILKINGIIVLEHHMKDEEVHTTVSGYELIKQKKYGITGVSVFRRIK
jgi:16S rRNA (guanine(966)-N(2))-methyltransferase RsmD